MNATPLPRQVTSRPRGLPMIAIGPSPGGTTRLPAGWPKPGQVPGFFLSALRLVSELGTYRAGVGST
jgi:hypothetical protein